MKKSFLTCISILIFSLILRGQNSPQAFNYQGIATDISDAPIVNTSIGLQIELLEGSAMGTVIYTETHSRMTNASGIFNAQIGRGTTSDSFSGIDWLSNSYYIRIGIDIAGGSNYDLMASVELLAVPYAIAAEQADQLRGFPISGSPATGDVLVWTGTQWTPSMPSPSGVVSNTAGEGIIIQSDGNGNDTISSVLGLSIENEELAANAVTSDNIQDYTIQASDLASGVIPNTGDFVDLTSAQTIDGTKLFNDINALAYKINTNTTLTATSSCIGLGRDNEAKGNNNVFIGRDIGTGLSGGGENVFIGNFAGSQSSGFENVFLGFSAGMMNSSGSRNTYIGANAGEENTTGYDNVFIGNRAGIDNTTGRTNVFIGKDSGYKNTIGRGNTFVGNDAGSSNIGGDNNVFLGRDAGQSNSEGENNVYLGYYAGKDNTIGTGNVFIGHRAGESESVSNKLIIANSNTTSPLIYGDFSANTFTLNGEAYKTTGSTWLSPSDRNLKDIGTAYTHSLDAINQINPVHFQYKKDNPLGLPSDKIYIGIIAQELQKAIPEAVSRNNNGYLQVNNDPVIWALVNATKELSGKIDRLEEENTSLLTGYSELNQKYESLFLVFGMVLLLVLAGAAWVGYKQSPSRREPAFA